MKVLFIGSGCACRLPFAESIFKKKLLEADVTGVEVETADVAEWGLVPTVGDVLQRETSAREVLDEADLIVVMEDKQRDFLTKFMDYSCWSKIHLFWDYCKRKTGMKTNITRSHGLCNTARTSSLMPARSADLLLMLLLSINDHAHTGAQIRNGVNRSGTHFESL